MKPLLVFAPGAGLPSTSPWMQAWAARLGAFGRVVLFDWPYTLAGRRRPDRMPTLVDAMAAVLQRERRAGEPIALVGKSLGSRVACRLAASEPEVRGVVAFGYPLVGARGRSPDRDGPLLELRCPILLIQGTRDEMCPLDALDELRRRMTAQSRVEVVDGGDHSLQITVGQGKRTGRDQRAVDEGIEAAVRGFLESACAGVPPA